MAEIIGMLVQLLVPMALLMLALVVGHTVERAHLASLAHREAALAHIQLTDLKTPPADRPIARAFVVTGSVVIANDYFKAFVASLRNLFGGRMRTFEILVERARREALVRMQLEAQAGGATAVWNIRIETSCIQGQQQKRAGGIEVIAYGTALTFE